MALFFFCLAPHGCFRLAQFNCKGQGAAGANCAVPGAWLNPFLTAN